MVSNLFEPTYPDDLSVRARDQIIRGAIEVAITDGYTRTYTMGVLRDKNIHFADSLFRAHWNEISNYRSRFEAPTYLDWDRKPNPALFTEGRYGITAKYGYVGQVTFWDDAKQEERYHTFRMDTDNVLTKAEAYDQLTSIASFQSSPPGEIISDVIYLGAFKNPEDY